MQNVEKISVQTTLLQSEISSTITGASHARCARGTWRASPSYWTARTESTAVRTTRGEENKLVCALLQVFNQEVLFGLWGLWQGDCSQKRRNQSEEAASAWQGLPPELLQVRGELGGGVLRGEERCCVAGLQPGAVPRHSRQGVLAHQEPSSL